MIFDLEINLISTGSTINLINGSANEAPYLIKKAEQKKDLMGEDTLTISYESPVIVPHSIGDNISLFGERYTLNILPSVVRLSNGNYQHDLVFESRIYELIKILFLDIDKSGNNWIGRTSEFPLTGPIDRFLEVVSDNITRVHGSDVNWKPITISYNEADLPTEVKTISFSSSNCLQALQDICKEFDVQYHVEVGLNDAITIYINKKTNVSVFPDTLEYGYNGGLFEIKREVVNTKGIVTRLYAYGGTRNIPYNYRNGSPRLKLPIATNIDSFVNNALAISKFGVIEQIKNFDDIYPTYKYTVSNSDGYLTFGGCPFDLNAVDGQGQTIYIVAGVTPKIAFNSGELAGYEFEIDKFDSATSKITLKPFTDSSGAVYPFNIATNPSGVYCIANGDEFIMLDIKPDSTKIAEAEALLLTKANEYLAANVNPEVSYSLHLDEYYFLEKYASEMANGTISNPFVVGQYLKINDDEMGIDNLQLRISSLTRDVLNPYRYTLEISDTYTITYLERLVTDNKATKEIIVMNKLQDPIRAKRNWQSTSELSNMLDTVKAEMLLIGDIAGSYYTDLVVMANYNNSANGLNVSTGTLQHQAYENNTNGTWNISSSFTTTLGNTSAYYVYVKCSKTAQTGEIVVSQTKIEVEGVASYYHFPLGILSSVFSDMRVFNSTRGYTQITGSGIKTGMIQSTNGSLKIDLDNAFVQGALKFTSGTNVETALNAVDEKAISAQSAADSAATAASNAQTSANTANALLSDIASDSKLTPSEKPSVRKEWDIIASEKVVNDTQADAFSVSKTAYGTAFQALANYLNNGTTWSTGIPSWISDANLSTTTTIVGSTFRSTFKAYYDARTALLNAISTKAKTLADAAQNSANNAQTTASNAATAASNAQTSANTANNAIADISNDDKVTPSEKQALKLEWDTIVSEKTKNDTQADVFGVSKTAYGTAYSTLSTFIGTNLSNLTTTWDLGAGGGATMRTNFKNYYDARTDILNAIAAKAKTLADAAQSTASSAVTTANNAQTAADGKAKKFTGTSNPTPPYVAGRDIWTNGTDLLECVVSRASGSYVANDFVKATGYDNTQTVIDGGVVTGGTLQVVQGGTVAAGMTGNTSGDSAVRFWAGSTLANRATAPFRVLQDGSVVMTKATMTGANVSGNISAVTGNIGDWEISYGGMFNDTDTAYIIARKSVTGGNIEARIGSNVVSVAAGIACPAWFMNEMQNNGDTNIALILTSKHGSYNYGVLAEGNIVTRCGTTISSGRHYKAFNVGTSNTIDIRLGTTIHVRNTTGSAKSLYLPTLAQIRDALMIGSFSVECYTTNSSTTTTTYNVKKGNGLHVGDAIKYGASAYETIIIIDRSPASYDTITVETSLGVGVTAGGFFTAVHEFSVEITIIYEKSEAGVTQWEVLVTPNGSVLYDNTGASRSSLSAFSSTVMKIAAFTRRNVMYYQLIHYKNA